MKKLCLILVFGMMLVGCATVNSPTNVIPDLPNVTSPEDLGTLVSNPIFDRLMKHSQETLDWVNNGSYAPTDPLMIARAKQCPEMIMLAIPSIEQKALAMKVKFQLVKDHFEGVKNGDFNLMLDLTKLRYSTEGAPGIDIEGDFNKLKNEVLEISAAVYDSCKAILPMKQFNGLIEKAVGVMIK